MPPSGHRRLMRQAAPSTARASSASRLALVRRAVRAQLAARQVAEPDAIAARRMDGHGARPGRSRCRRDAGRRRGGRLDRLTSTPKLQLPTPKASARTTPGQQLTPQTRIPNRRSLERIRTALGVGSWKLGSCHRQAVPAPYCPDKAHHPTDRNSEHGDPDLPTALPHADGSAGTSHELSCNEPFTASIQCACEPSWCARRLTKDARTGHFDPR